MFVEYILLDKVKGFRFVKVRKGLGDHRITVSAMGNLTGLPVNAGFVNECITNITTCQVIFPFSLLRERRERVQKELELNELEL